MFSAKVLLATATIMLFIGAAIGYGISLYTYKPPAPVEELKIGILEPLSGGYAEGGIRRVRCYEEAAEEINAAGGILGKKIVLVLEDTAGDPTTAITVCRKLINLDKVYAISGLILSSEVMAVAPVCAEGKTMLFCTNPVTNAFTDLVSTDYNTYKYLFRPQLNQTQWALDWFDEMFNAFGFMPKKVMFFTEDLLWAREVYQTMVDKWGSQVEVTKLFFAPGKTDFTAEIELIKNQNPDILMVDLLLTSSLSFLRQWDAARPDIFTFHVAGESTTVSNIEALGTAMNDYHTMWCNAWNVSLTLKTQHFFSRQKEILGFEPACQSDIRCYDTLFILKDAVERAGTFDVDDVIQALEQTSYVGACGTYEFYSNHQAKPLPGVVIQWKDNKKYVVYPERVANKEFEWPPWLTPRG